MRNFDRERISQEILTYSLQPRRYSIFIKLIRNVLWRLARPFHFYHISQALELYKNCERQIQELKSIGEMQEQKINKLFESTSGMPDLTTRMRVEYLPLMNRITWLEDENESLKTTITEIKNFLKIV
jgi:hypothetical protein